MVSDASAQKLLGGPAEAFVLACIDGVNTLADIAQTTGLRLEEVTRIIEVLVARGVVAFAERQSGRHALRPPAAASPSGEYPLVRLGEPSAAVEMSAEQQRHLLDLDRRLGSFDHYELLGVEPGADAKLVRAAYYGLVRTLHPDRFFGKQLGSFEGKLLRVFAKITEAYEVLRRPESRAEYDAVRPTSADAPVSSGSALRRPSSSVALDPEARKRALARKLGHSSLPPARSPSIPSSPPISSSRSAEEIKQRYEQRLAQAREEQRLHYVTLANEAAERKDLIAAANALRVACSLAPGDLELRGDLAEMERRAASELWEAYAERAKYAALEGYPAEAAESYKRAALGHPSAALFERAAFHTVEAEGDLKHAAQLAKQAVSLAPSSAKCRLTLAQVYAAAKLRESALAELERARALDPESHIIKDWILRVKRGE